MGDPSGFLALSGAIGTRYEGPGQGSRQGRRHGKPSITLHCPSHRTPPGGHRGTQETAQLSRSERPGPEWIPTAKIHPCQPYMIPTTTPFIPDGPFVHTHYVLIRVTGGSSLVYYEVTDIHSSGIKKPGRRRLAGSLPRRLQLEGKESLPQRFAGCRRQSSRLSLSASRN